METPKGRKRTHQESTSDDPNYDVDYSEPEKDSDEDEEYYANIGTIKAGSSSILMKMVERQRNKARDDDDDDEEEEEESLKASKKRRKRAPTPLINLLGEESKSDKNFSANRDTAFLAYDESYWSPAHLYRLPSDITLQRIHSSGGEGVGRVEVGHALMMDTSTKAGNRRVSSFIVNVCNDNKDLIGQYQKMDGKVRSIKYYWKTNDQPEKFQKLFDDFEKFSGLPCPFKLGQVIKFPHSNLNTLRISDVTLRRLNDLIEMLSQTPVIVTIHRVLKYVEDKEKATGYNFSIDKKSLIKCIKALENENLVRFFETSVNCDGATNKVQILCHRDVKKVDDPIVKEYIEKTIDQYHKEGRVFPHGQLRYSVKKREELEAQEQQVTQDDILITNFDSTAPLSIENRFNLFRAMSARAILIKKEKDEPLDNPTDAENTLNNTFEDSMNNSADNAVSDTGVTTTDASTTAVEEEDKKPSKMDNSKNPTVTVTAFYSDTLDASILDDEIIPVKTPIDQKRIVKLNTSMANLYGYQSKALRFGILHEIAYHFVHGLPLDKKPTFYEKFPLRTPPIMWDFNPHPTVYVHEEGPLRFVPPLPPYDGMPRGWFMLHDFVCALPLSVFVLVAYVPKTIDNSMLDEYLRDPIRRHTIVGDLPSELRLSLIQDKKVYRQIEHSLLCLCAMGLMCVGQNPDPKRFVTAASSVFYVAKRGVLYDTSTSARGYATISEPLSQYEAHKYNFDSLNDVQVYWHHLRAIVQSTPLAFRMDMSHSEAALQRHKKYSLGLIDRSKMTYGLTDDVSNLLPLEPRDGCAGFDSSLFLHLRRHWDLNPRPSPYVTWFIKRFRKTAEDNMRDIESRVAMLAPDWNSFVKSLMPSDLDLSRNKKAVATSTTIYPSTRASIAIEPKSKTRLQSSKKTRDWKRKKRPLDSVDMVSQENRVHVRCRFNSVEKDHLILIRAVGFFLNPVYRFWLEPTVLRDIMHEYVPESRTKTVQSLMAAGVREMVRPQRLAYLQRIVRNLSTFQEMRDLRTQLGSESLVTSAAKTSFFKNAFAVAKRLLYMDHQNMPHTSASDDDFSHFMINENFVLSPEQSHGNPMPLRCLAPVFLPHIHHCVAVNVLLSILIHSNGGVLSEKILSQLNATVIHNALQILRSDGLVSRHRHMDPQLLVMTKNQAVLSYYFRHFFAHRYHPDIIDETNRYFRDFPPVKEGAPVRVVYTGDHVGLIIAASNTFYTDNELDVSVDPQILSVFEDASLENAQQSTKQIRYLENADLHLENIRVSHVLKSDFQQVMKVKDLINVLDKSQDNSLVVAASPTIYIKSFSKVTMRSPMEKVYKSIKEGGILGKTIEEIMKETRLKKSTVKDAITNCIEGHIIIEVGVDAIRWISYEFRDAWCIIANKKILFPKPWTLPDATISHPTVRWMAESCLFTIVASAGITLKDLQFRYQFVLQPAAVTELVHLLEKAGCVKIHEEEFKSMVMDSPFDDDLPPTSCTYLLPTVDCVERFARVFSDIPLLPSMSPAERQDQDDRLDYEYIDDGEYRNGNLDGKNPDNHTKDCDTTLEENPGTLKDALRGLMS